ATLFRSREVQSGFVDASKALSMPEHSFDFSTDRQLLRRLSVFLCYNKGTSLYPGMFPATMLCLLCRLETGMIKATYFNSRWLFYYLFRFNFYALLIFFC